MQCIKDLPRGDATVTIGTRFLKEAGKDTHVLKVVVRNEATDLKILAFKKNFLG